uniref:Uncharacterized protein n=1 Tax=Cucumis melo TaxID=3656 RepID=A0A9I9E8S8_CUCME
MRCKSIKKYKHFPQQQRPGISKPAFPDDARKASKRTVFFRSFNSCKNKGPRRLATSLRACQKQKQGHVIIEAMQARSKRGGRRTTFAQAIRKANGVRTGSGSGSGSGGGGGGGKEAEEEMGIGLLAVEEIASSSTWMSWSKKSASHSQSSKPSSPVGIVRVWWCLPMV